MKDWKFLFEKYILGQHKPIEAAVIHLMKRMRGDLFVDVGANRGIYTRMMEGRFARIVSFEPYPYPDLIPTYRYALSDYDGDDQPFYVNSGNGSADTLLREFTYKPDPSYTGVLEAQTFKTEKTMQVSVRRYDTVIREIADLVKIDVEGAELAVLRGMTGSLPRSLIVEVHNRDQMSEILNWLRQNDYLTQLLDSHPHILASHILTLEDTEHSIPRFFPARCFVPKTTR